MPGQPRFCKKALGALVAFAFTFEVISFSFPLPNVTDLSDYFFCTDSDDKAAWTPAFISSWLALPGKTAIDLPRFNSDVALSFPALPLVSTVVSDPSGCRSPPSAL